MFTWAEIKVESKVEKGVTASFEYRTGLIDDFV